jgi:hypothetical protein
MVDFDKIREKVAQLSGNRKTSFWVPQEGKEYNIRILPWPDGNDGQPFKERAFYYNIAGGRGILAPSQFHKEDPVQELINKLRQSGTPKDLELAKQFYPKRRYFAPVIVRGSEEEAPKLWSLGKQIASDILQAMLGDFGDVTDLKEGRDLKIICTKAPGKQFADVKVQPRLQATAAGTAKQIKEWMAAIPNLDEIYTEMDYATIAKRVQDHLTNAAAPTKESKSVSGIAEDESDIDDVTSASLDEVFEKVTQPD